MGSRETPRVAPVASFPRPDSEAEQQLADDDRGHEDAFRVANIVCDVAVAAHQTRVRVRVEQYPHDQSESSTRSKAPITRRSSRSSRNDHEPMNASSAAPTTGAWAGVG